MILWCFNSIGYSQQIIGKIQFEGNSRTKSTYLKHFIKTQKGEVPDSLKIEDDLRKLRNLTSVMDAEAILTDSDSGVMLTYSVNERFTLLPVGDFGITRNNFWIGGGLMESNLGGRGIYSYAYYQYNSKHTLHLIFRNPYIKGTPWGIELQLRNLPSVENYTEDSKILNQYFDISLAGRYEFRLENEIALGTSFRQQIADNSEINNSLEEFAIYNKRQTQVFFLRREIHRLDYHYFYVTGWKNLLHLSCQIPYSSHSGPVLTIYNELKFFARPFNKGNFATRFMAGISSEKEKAFYPFLADSYYSLRGIGYRVFRGNAIALLNLEYRQTLFENRLGGIQLVVFSDAGFIPRFKGATLDRTDYNPDQLFSGLGLRFIYKKAYNAIISIDYGFDVLWQKKAGLVVEWGQYF